MSEDPVRAAVAQQAADWFVTNQDEAAARRSAAEFMAWLRLSPLHVEEYLCVAAVAGDLQGASAAGAQSIEDLIAEARADRGPVATIGRVQTPPARRSRMRRWAPMAVGALCAGVLVALVAQRLLPRTPEAPPLLLSTLHGDRQNFTLADGSSVELNSDTAVRVRFTGAERLVEVERGQAFFHVAKDAARRFRVAAGGASVVAIGTQFDVHRRGDEAVVAVVEGHVAVYATDPRRDAAVAIDGSAPVHLHGGEMIAVHGAVAANQVEPFDARQVEAWRSGRILFEERPLAEVAAEFNQYSNPPIEILDASLGAMRISGAFSAGDLDSFIAFVGSLDDVRVKRTATHVEVSRRPTAGQRHSVKNQ